jgi:chemotaxis protein CheD
MGEIEVSKRTGEELVARGLGSCIGLALIDRQSGVAGMAHIVLPESAGSEDEPGKFADLAVPELIAQMQKAGAVMRRVDAVLAGGARMFELGEMDIGARNAAAVKAGLARSGVKVRAADTGGNRGRTMRLTVGDFEVTVKEAGGQQVTLFDAGAQAPAKTATATAAATATATSRATTTARATATARAIATAAASRRPPRAAALGRPTMGSVSARSAAAS